METSSHPSAAAAANHPHLFLPGCRWHRAVDAGRTWILRPARSTPSGVAVGWSEDDEVDFQLRIVVTLSLLPNEVIQ